MHSFRFVLLTLTIVLTAAVDSRWSAASFAGAGVELRLPGHYLAEPATVHIDVTVPPNAENRVLRVEADGENFFRAADVPLEGAKAPKFHVVWFKNLPGGHYTIRACVLSSADKLALAEAELVVMH